MNEELLKSLKATIALIETDVFPLMKYDYEGGNFLVYLGRNTAAGADDGAATWRISKYTYTDNKVDQIKTLTGSWTGRAGLGW